MSELSAFVFHRNRWAVPAARREMRALTELPRGKREDVELVVSELVTAALMGDGRETDLIELTVERQPARVLVEVSDRGAKATSVPVGVGAQLLDSVCESWRPAEGSVTASIALDHTPPSAARRHGLLAEPARCW